MTFSEKGTKMTTKLLISKFEIISFFLKIHEKKIFHSFFSSEKRVTLVVKKSLFLSILLEKLRITNFEMWS